MIYIKYIDYYVPNDSISSEEFVENISINSIPKNFINKSEYLSFLKENLKLKKIPLELHNNNIDMLSGLFEKFLASMIVLPQDIQLIILAQESSKYQASNLVKEIKSKYLINNSITLNLCGNNCANVHFAVEIAKKLILSTPDVSNVIILSLVKIEGYENRVVGKYGVIGDGAGILLISRDMAKIKLIDSCSISSSILTNDENIGSSLIHFKYISYIINKILKRNQKSPADFGKIIIQNANSSLVIQCLKCFNFDIDKVFSNNLTKYSHLDCLDYIVNLCDLQNECNENLNLLILDSGEGGSYIISYYQIIGKT